MPEENEDTPINTHRKNQIRASRRKWLQKQANFKISDSPLDNRV